MKTSLSGTLLSVQKSEMNLTKWDTILFESFQADEFTNTSVFLITLYCPVNPILSVQITL